TGLRRADSLAGHGNNVHSVHFSPDGSQLVSSGNDHFTRVWDLTGEGRREVAVLGEGVPGGGPNNNCSAFAPHGQHIAVGVSGASIRMFDMSRPSPREEIAYASLTGTVNSLAFSPDLRWLVCSTNEHRVTLYEAISRRPVAFWDLPGAVAAVA